MRDCFSQLTTRSTLSARLRYRTSTASLMLATTLRSQSLPRKVKFYTSLPRRRCMWNQPSLSKRKPSRPLTSSRTSAAHFLNLRTSMTRSIQALWRPAQLSDDFVKVFGKGEAFGWLRNWKCTRQLYCLHYCMPLSLRRADVFAVVASLPPKNNICEPERQND